MKTRLDYFNELPEPYKSQAINNTPVNELTVGCVNLVVALAGGFTFQYTPEGHSYWENVMIKYNNEN